jgi:hypothetical protein
VSIFLEIGDLGFGEELWFNYLTKFDTCFLGEVSTVKLLLPGEMRFLDVGDKGNLLVGELLITLL